MSFSELVLHLTITVTGQKKPGGKCPGGTCPGGMS